MMEVFIGGLSRSIERNVTALKPQTLEKAITIEVNGSVFSRTNCTKDCKVKFSTGTLTEEALSWWNSFAQPIGIEEAYKIILSEFNKLLIKKITMDLLPHGFLEPLYPGFMNVVHNQDIEHMIPPTPPRDIEPPIGSPMPLSPSSSVESSSPVRSTTPPPDYPFDESIFAELDKSLWIIPRPLGSEPIFEEPNESDAC
nr:reverse transcriptase domain-containing protein [Tanacetum cinerariifolium]